MNTTELKLYKIVLMLIIQYFGISNGLKIEHTYCIFWLMTKNWSLPYFAYEITHFFTYLASPSSS